MTDAFKPLDGIRVLDFSHVIAGPLATFYLAQLGARVIKIESAEGDVMQGGLNGARTYTALNAGKEVLRLDLKSADGRARAEALSAEADIVMDNLRPGALERLGLGPAAVLARNPRMIYCSVSGYGRSGPQAGRPAYDHVVQAATGMAMMGGLEGEGPVKVGFPAVDAASAMLAAFAILAALRERDRTGRAVLLDVSMAGAALQMMYPAACDALTRGVVPPRVGNKAFSGSPAADMFRCSDGWIAIAANRPAHVAALLKALGLAALLDDQTVFETRPGAGGPAGFAKAKDPVKLGQALARAMAAETLDVIEKKLAAANVPAARLRRLDEFAAELKAAPPANFVTLGDGEAQVLSPGLGFVASFPNRR